MGAPDRYGSVVFGSQKPRQEQADEFLAMIDLEEFDAVLARRERLDAMIDKTVKRLVILENGEKKVYNRIEQPR